MKFMLKKITVVLFVIIMILTVSSCNKENSQSDVSDNISEVVSEITSSEETDSSSDTDSNSQVSSSIPQAESKPQEVSKESQSSSTSSKENEENVCKHDYIYLEVGVTCTKGGYKQYECRKCGHTYKGEAVAAHHDYGKYLCEQCGKIDPELSNIFWGINAWIERFGEENGKGNMYCYPNDTAAVAIGTPLQQPTLYLEYTDNTNLISFSLSVDNKADCTLQFSDMKTNAHASCDDIKNSAVSSANKLEFSYFNSSDGAVDRDVFATECAKRIDTYMKAFQDILSKSGITLKDLGFTAYK